MPRDHQPRADIYTRITDKIVSSLEDGVRPWIKPWNAEHAAGRITRPLRANGIPYRGINILVLWMDAQLKGFNAPIWMTFKQALEHDACVRKGEKGSLVVYANTFSKTEQDADGNDFEQQIPFLKGYTVFNVDQIDGLPPHFYAQAEPPAETPPERIERCEAFFKATKADLTHGGDRACYAVGLDQIRMPVIETFRDAESYYATLAHETIHWTRHPSRLDRSFGREKWGDEGYAREELVAELGSAFLSADLALTPEVRDDHAAYIASWIQVLQNDKRAIFQAAAHAQRAADFLHDLQSKAALDDPDTLAA